MKTNEQQANKTVPPEVTESYIQAPAQRSGQAENIYQRLHSWLTDVNDHEVKQLVEVVEEAKSLALAAESLSEERVTQFVANFKYDIQEFFQHWRETSDNSVYLGLLNETWWDTLAKAADKTQIEWAELPEDFAHDGVYKSGDVIGFGVLECCECHHQLTVSHFSEVPECSECGHQEFNRLPLSP